MSIPAEPGTPDAPAELHSTFPAVALCEPDGPLRALFEEWLQRGGYTPLRCECVACAARVVLVIADFPMPQCEGAGRIAMLRRRFPGARVLAISSQFTPRMHGATAAAATLGVDAVLAKPFSCQPFMAQVRALVGSAASSAPGTASCS
jgi:DNA-binding response OmpR family regulator